MTTRSPLEERLRLRPRDAAAAGQPAASTSTQPARYEGWPAPGQSHVYGGLVVAQAVAAAAFAGGGWSGVPCAVHAAFCRAGRADRPLLHAVTDIRTGTSFATRWVEVTQPGLDEPVLVATVSFQRPEEGEEYQLGMPQGLPSPEALGPGRYDGEVFDCRDVPAGVGPAAPPHARRMWFRARGTLPADPLLHLLGLVYASDHGPTRAVRQPHVGHPGVERRMSVSLDHSVWLHRPARCDEWLLSELSAASTEAARGLASGHIWTADGRLVASVAQLALLRLPGAG